MHFYAAFSVTALLGASFVHADDTTCASGQLDWYTGVVGETPCQTYSKLRQICNNDYQVPRLNTSQDDQCNEQVADCCCNAIAFQLSMLCLNCQRDAVHDSQGIDAPIGVFDHYRANCGINANSSLPDDIQQAVCNKNVRIDDFLYEDWEGGQWSYVTTKDAAMKLHADNGNNSFTHCPNQRTASPSTGVASILEIPSSQISSPVSRTDTPSAPMSSSFGTSTPPVVGEESHGGGGSSLSFGASAAIGVVVGAGGVFALAGAAFLLWRRHKRANAPKCASDMVRRSIAPKPFPGPVVAETSPMVSPFPISTGGRGLVAEKYRRFR
ncbi:hypothetical protein C8Q79DRAFT_202553 [Trametes meyenii]|nr:hypothetical protein C8Q79DRAFT_202553 [Trametes meyenii]